MIKAADKLVNAGEALYATGYFAEAEEAFKKALRLYNICGAVKRPGAAWAADGLLRIYRAMRRREDAESLR